MILNTFHNRSLLTYIGVLVPRCWALAWNEEKDSPTLKIEVWGRAQKNRNFFRLVRQKYLKKFAIHAQCHGWNLKCFSFFSFSIDDDGQEKSERSRKNLCRVLIQLHVFIFLLLSVIAQRWLELLALFTLIWCFYLLRMIMKVMFYFSRG